MTKAPNVRIAVILVLLVGGVAGYRWWTSPERQIRAMLNTVAAAFTYDEADNGLEALTAVATLQEHLKEDVLVEARDGTRMTGRQEVITAAARIRAATPMMRVRFFDQRTSFADATSGSLSVTAEVTTRTGAGEDLVDVHQVTARVERVQGHWLVATARVAADAEPPPP